MNVRRQDDVFPAAQALANAVQRNTVAVEVVHDSVLQELLRLEELVILSVAEKVIVHTVLFSDAARSRRGRHAVRDRKTVLFEVLDQCRFANP